MTPHRGLLQLVASPIGNLGDITLRAVEGLKGADLIACEDTRHSSRLLQHLGISGKELVSLHDHNEDARSASIVNRILLGSRVAFLSDAGMPTVSDPGYRLVRACVEAGVRVEVLPGASAVVTALAGSGLPTDAFYFGGFLPVKSGKRRHALEEALARSETSIFFESPHRLARTLSTLAELAPERDACVARELTKAFETYHRGTATELAAEFATGRVRGEITLLVRGLSRSERKLRDRGNEKDRERD